MEINFKEIKRLLSLIQRSKHDPLIAFLANGEAGKLERIQKQNFENLISLCKKHNIRYLYIGLGELCSKPDAGRTGWPPIWTVARELGFRSCGNGDQYQTSDFDGVYFPKDTYGAWDLVEDRKLTNEESIAINFNKVVTSRKL